MKKSILRVGIAAVSLAAFMLVTVTADPKQEDIIARVADVQGSSLLVQRKGSDKWLESKKNTAGFIKDHFKTDKKTTAAIELLIGARVGIKQGSEIVLLSDDEAGTTDGKTVSKIMLNSGGAYAKFHKQDKPLTIQTRGGVMGIKGTEFSVDTTEDGQTDIVLLEGSVDYTDNNGNVTELEPGQKMSQFEKDDELYVIKGEPQEVDARVADFLSGAIPITNIHSIQDVLNTNWSNLGPDIVNNIISSGRSSILKELPGPVGDLVNQFLPSTYINWTGVSWSYPGIYIPSVPGIPSLPSFP